MKSKMYSDVDFGFHDRKIVHCLSNSVETIQISYSKQHIEWNHIAIISTLTWGVLNV